MTYNYFVQIIEVTASFGPVDKTIDGINEGHILARHIFADFEEESWIDFPVFPRMSIRGLVGRSLIVRHVELSADSSSMIAVVDKERSWEWGASERSISSS